MNPFGRSGTIGKLKFFVSLRGTRAKLILGRSLRKVSVLRVLEVNLLDSMKFFGTENLEHGISKEAFDKT